MATFIQSFSISHERCFEHTAKLSFEAQIRFVFHQVVFARLQQLQKYALRSYYLLGKIHRLPFIRWNEKIFKAS